MSHSPNIRSSVEFNGKKNQQSVIDEHLFIELIALISFEIPYHNQNLTKVEKIILLIERMNRSDGPNKV